MPKKPVVHEPNKVLRAPAAEVPRAEIQSAPIQRLIADMKETLAASPDGVGLAAPQVGTGLRIFLVSEEALFIDEKNMGRELAPEVAAERPKKNWKQFVFINPALLKHSRRKNTMTEGCLSVPGTFGAVTRAEKVALAWYDEAGRKHSRGFTKFFARVIQHELDHLQGILIVDKAKNLFRVTKREHGKII